MSNGDDEQASPESDAKRLAEDHTKDELQELAREADLKIGGRKAEIAERLVDAGVTPDGASGEADAAAEDAAPDDEPEVDDADADEGEATDESEDADESSEEPLDTPEDAPAAADEADETPDEQAAEAAAEDEDGTGAAETEADAAGEPEDAEEEPEEDSADEAADEEASEEDEAGDAAEEGEDEEALVATADPEELNERLDAIESELDEAETESDLDAIEPKLDAVEARVEDLPEPDEDADEDEDEEDPKADLEARVSDLRDELEDKRGPYAEDVVEQLETAQSTITDSEWTDQGEREVAETVSAFLDDVNEILETDLSVSEDADLATQADAVGDAADAVGVADLDPDDDEETIAALIEAADDLQAGLDDAQTWDDLTVREKLEAQGFFDVLTSKNRKDFPPELSVVRIAESEKDPEPILLAMEYLTSEFMQENCMKALKRLGAPEAFDEMHERAQKRRELPIQVLGKIGDPRALDTLHEFIEGDSNPNLQRVVLKTVGEIGSEESTQHVADRLVAEEDEVRSAAARALGRIGDTRAIDPLSDVLADDDNDSVRTSAAWALVQIGTEDALETAAEYDDDRSYIVQVEAEKARGALDEGEEAHATA